MTYEVKTPVQAYVCFLKAKIKPSKLSTKSRPCDKEKQEILTFQRLDPFSVQLFFPIPTRHGETCFLGYMQIWFPFGLIYSKQAIVEMIVSI